MIDTVIKGGTVVTPAGVGSWDIGLEGEKIAAVTMPGVLSTEGVRVIDVTGKIVVREALRPMPTQRLTSRTGCQSWFLVRLTLAQPFIPWAQFGEGPRLWSISPL